jgi:hypothetical protein
LTEASAFPDKTGRVFTDVYGMRNKDFYSGDFQRTVINYPAYPPNKPRDHTHIGNRSGIYRGLSVVISG